MVRTIKVVNIYVPEETTREDDEEQEQASEPTTTKEPEDAIDETSADTEERAAAAVVEEPLLSSALTSKEVKPSPKPIDIKTNSKILEQVSCQACGKFMSAKNLRYARTKYCTALNKEEQPPEITTSEVEVEETPPEKNIKKVPVKRAKAKAKPQRPREGPPTPPTQENGGILPPGLEAPYKGQKEIEETPEQFWGRTMRDLKDKKRTQYNNLCLNAV